MAAVADERIVAVIVLVGSADIDAQGFACAAFRHVDNVPERAGRLEKGWVILCAVGVDGSAADGHIDGGVGGFKEQGLRRVKIRGQGDGEHARLRAAFLVHGAG